MTQDPWLRIAPSDELWFRASVFDRPADFEREDTALGVGLRASVDHARGAVPIHVARTGYRLLAETETRALLATGEPPVLGSIMFLVRRGGQWMFEGCGNRSTVQVARRGMGRARWIEHERAGPAASRLVLDVTEMTCASGRSAEDRLQPPEIVEDDKSVTISWFVRRLPGPQECPGNPVMRRVVGLARPLSTRLLLDGALYPPQPLGVSAPR